MMGGLKKKMTGIGGLKPGGLLADLRNGLNLKKFNVAPPIKI